MSSQAQLCSGYGQFHTDKNGSAYDSITLDEIFKMAVKPNRSAKNDAQWVIFSELKSRVFKEQFERGSFHAIWADIDEHCEIDDIKGVLAKLGSKYLIHSSSRSKIEKKKWRVIVPLRDAANGDDYTMLAQILNDKLEDAGITPDRASERPAQLCYLPNRDPDESTFYEQVANWSSRLDWRVQFKDELAAKHQQAGELVKQAQKIREQSRAKAIERVTSGELSPRNAFIECYSIEDRLLCYGYMKKAGKWLSPNSDSNVAGVIIKGGKWISSHASDTGIGVSKDGNQWGDAFDLYVFYEHGGNENSAMKAAGSMFTTSEGVTLTKANQRKHKALQSNVVTMRGDGEEDLAELCVSADWQRDLLAEVLKMNDEYALVLVGSKNLVMKTRLNSEGRKERVFMPVRSLVDSFANRRIITGIRENGKPIYQTLGTSWLEHYARADFKDGIVFEPSSYKGGVEIPAKVSRSVLNLWEGFSVKPKQGDCQRLYDHILNVVCDGSVECSEYLLNWIARGLQYPSKNGQVATVLKGEKGSGKSTLGKLLGSLYGQHALQVTNPRHLVGNFNGHLQDCAFMFADESFFAGDRQHENILKALITEDSLMIERKGIDAAQAKNRIKLLMASNNDWVAPASRDERRYFVLDVSSERVGDAQYFKELHSDIQRDDVKAAFLHDMLNRDLSKFVVGKIPETSGLQSQRLQSLDSFGKYWTDVLERGYLIETTVGGNDGYDFSAWISEPAIELISAGYQQWISKHRLSKFDIASQTAIGHRLSKWYGAKKRSRERRVAGCDYQGNKIMTGDRAAYYSLGSLEDATKTFCDYEKVELSMG